MTGKEIGHIHRDVTGGWLRPAVFGAMDGLVSNFALMAGFAGGASAAGVGTQEVILAGVAGLLAGAFSMAVGEYVSVSSQVEMAYQEVEVERKELRDNPDAELRELAKLWESRGLSSKLALEVASALTKDPDEAVRVHVREELGFSVSDLPSPWVAAISSFVAFCVGAVVPLLPYLITALPAGSALDIANIGWLIGFSSVGLFVAGAVVSKVTTRPWWYSGIRQMLLGVAAAGLTYAVGSLIGANI
jgi:VIT1/CCC1 family predicted Fe2+/Mn2+ transporter